MKNWIYITIGIVLSFIIIISKYLFTNTPELFKGGAFLLDVLLFNLSLAFLASSIFYFLTVYLPRKRDLKNIHQSIRLDINGIIGGTKVLFNSLYRHVQKEPNYYEISLDELNEICPKIKLKGKAPILPGFITYTDLKWADYILFYKERQNQLINKILVYTPFLDSQFIKLLGAIKNSEYYTLCDNWVKYCKLATEPDLTSFADALDKYHQKILDLENYCKNKKMIDQSI